MKYLEAIERLSENHDLVFEADYDGSPLQLCGDEDGSYIFALEGLFEIGMPWVVFNLDWKEAKR